MTLGSLSLYLGIIALICTLAAGFMEKKVKNWLISFLQFFVGGLFVFSGFVKAIDPLGTAYKMEQYFAEFETTFEGTWFSFIAPLFPWLTQYVVSFSVFMIVLEIVLGLAIFLGAAKKLSSWVFLLLLVFFTFLTGFTYLTGYVPEGVNFFQFGQWGPYVETNMKVTDCGCFGDFMILKPKVSFLKDLVLLIPGLIFVWKHRQMHQILGIGARWAIIGIGTVGFMIYCLSNYVWDLPDIDFRPFKNGVNIAERKELEHEAESNVEIIAYKLTNKKTGEVLEVPYEAFLANISKYPKDQWDFDQIKSEPTVPHTKISDFDVSDVDGNEMTEEILSDSNYSFMVIAYKLYGKTSQVPKTVIDSTFAIDTLRMGDSIALQRRLTGTKERQETVTMYDWDANYLTHWKEVVNPVLESARKEGLKAYAITAYNDAEALKAFKEAMGADYPIYMADDILLKTIIRSNPGVLLMKNGTIVHKWHYKQLPQYDTIKGKFMK